MDEGQIKSLSEWDDKLSQMEPWALMAGDIADTFRRGELIGEKFTDSVSDLIKLGKDEDVIKLVKWYYKHYGGGKFGKEVFKKLVDLGYLDISKGREYTYFCEPQLLEAALYYIEAHPEKVETIKEIFHIK